jgi:hypothetical protein
MFCISWIVSVAQLSEYWDLCCLGGGVGTCYAFPNSLLPKLVGIEPHFWRGWSIDERRVRYGRVLTDSLSFRYSNFILWQQGRYPLRCLRFTSRRSELYLFRFHVSASGTNQTGQTDPMCCHRGLMPVEAFIAPTTPAISTNTPTDTCLAQVPRHPGCLRFAHSYPGDRPQPRSLRHLDADPGLPLTEQRISRRAASTTSDQLGRLAHGLQVRTIPWFAGTPGTAAR